jgi:hypothetical protein
MTTFNSCMPAVTAFILTHSLEIPFFPYWLDINYLQYSLSFSTARRPWFAEATEYKRFIPPDCYLRDSLCSRG